MHFRFPIRLQADTDSANNSVWVFSLSICSYPKNPFLFSQINKKQWTACRPHGPRYLPKSLSITSLSPSSIFRVISRRFSPLELIGACDSLTADDGTVNAALLEEVVASSASSGWDDAHTVIASNNVNTSDGSIFDFILFLLQKPCDVFYNAIPIRNI